MKTNSLSTHRQGFTLIEMMIVVAIVGILAAIAYPSYQGQLQKSRRADCQGVLVSIAGSMERYFTENNSYAGASLGAGGIDTNRCPVDGGTAYYNLTVPTATATAFSLLATRAGSQTGDSCGNLTLDNLGQKGVSGAATGFTADVCW